ncbi:MAG: AI-2E family transporter [Bacteroidota bacterium]|nr:MAG: AI-2E family transporter [Bacteroidota bacterium]
MNSNTLNDKKVFDISLKLILILIISFLCVRIILPFLVPVLWGVILAITLYPLYKKFSIAMKGNKVIPSLIITLVLLAILILPSYWLIASLAEEGKNLFQAIRDNTLVVAPPEQKVADWFLIGEPIYKAWQLIADNLEAGLYTYREPLLKLIEKLGSSFLNFTSSILMFVLSLIISGIFLAHTEKSEKSAKVFANHLLGSAGDDILQLVVQTIRNVAKGILGVAVIQFILMGSCLIMADVPLAGLWAFLVLILAIVQLPPTIVGIPVIIYLYSVKEPFPATLWTILILLISLSDNFLKPWLMGKGAPVPMLVIFLGAIGGFMMMGFIGLFTGAMILSIGYKLAGMWLSSEKKEA